MEILVDGPEGQVGDCSPWTQGTNADGLRFQLVEDAEACHCGRGCRGFWWVVDGRDGHARGRMRWGDAVATAVYWEGRPPGGARGR